jgi:thymidylate kinase
MAKLIVIEGPDKVGKETQSKLLTAYLKHNGHRATLVEVPFNDNFTHKAIYWMLRKGIAKSMPNLFQWTQYINKRIFQTYQLPELEADNDFVVLDRWALSAIVYGCAGGANPQWTRELCSRLRKPDLTIVLHGRSHIDRKDDVYEKDDTLQARVRVLYADHGKHDPDTVLVSCEGTRVNVHERVIEQVKKHGLL